MTNQIKIYKNPLRSLKRIFRKLPWLKHNDRAFIKWDYYFGMGKFPDLDNPKRFNEKLQWLKLHDKRPEYTLMVDKYEAKKYVAGILGEEYIIPTLGVWERFEDIDFDALPQQFVLKCTHDSGGLVICPDKSKLNIEKAQKKINKRLKRNQFRKHREYPYKGVKPRIIAEQFMVDESGTELKDYKFFCFNGEPKMLLLASNRGKGTYMNFYDMEFNLLPVQRAAHPNAKNLFVKPDGFDKMKQLAKTLSKGIPHIRVDFYNINGKIYFGELTFFSGSGNIPFHPDEWDYKIGEWLELPKE